MKLASGGARFGPRQAAQNLHTSWFNLLSVSFVYNLWPQNEHRLKTFIPKNIHSRIQKYTWIKSILEKHTRDSFYTPVSQASAVSSEHLTCIGLCASKNDVSLMIVIYNYGLDLCQRKGGPLFWCCPQTESNSTFLQERVWKHLLGIVFTEINSVVFLGMPCRMSTAIF